LKWLFFITGLEILQILRVKLITNNIATRELGITGALKFENCHFTVTAAKENK
jgi:hypothetical protein